MLKLRTIYPYGLNDSLNEPLKGVMDYSVGLNYPPLPRKYTRPNNGLLIIPKYCVTVKRSLLNSVTC